MQQQYTTTLEDMRGHVKRVRPGVDVNTIRDFLNQAVRSVLDSKSIWSGLIRRGVLSIPGAYREGSVSLDAGSPVLTGSGTNWPVSDVVNTTTATAVSEIGLVWITPASMVGIDVDSILYVDAGGTPEAVTVISTQRNRFLANFSLPHASGFTITASSLAGRQLRLGINYPIYTIMAVTAAGSAILDMPWAGTTLTNTSYNILKMYCTLDPSLKSILDMIDPVQPRRLAIHYPLTRMNFEDPQRNSSGPPTTLIDLTASQAGNMQYEVYPPQTVPRHLHYIYTIQWPEMVAPGDRPPFFINPNIFIYEALSKMLRIRTAKDDYGYDPATANYYQQMSGAELEKAKVADEDKVLEQLTSEYSRIGGGGGGINWAKSHAVSADEGNGGGSWW